MNSGKVVIMNVTVPLVDAIWNMETPLGTIQRRRGILLLSSGTFKLIFVIANMYFLRCFRDQLCEEIEDEPGSLAGSSDSGEDEEADAKQSRVESSDSESSDSEQWPIETDESYRDRLRRIVARRIVGKAISANELLQTYIRITY